MRRIFPVLSPRGLLFHQVDEAERRKRELAVVLDTQSVELRRDSSAPRVLGQTLDGSHQPIEQRICAVDAACPALCAATAPNPVQIGFRPAEMQICARLFRPHHTCSPLQP